MKLLKVREIGTSHYTSNCKKYSAWRTAELWRKIISDEKIIYIKIETCSNSANGRCIDDILDSMAKRNAVTTASEKYKCVLHDEHFLPKSSLNSCFFHHHINRVSSLIFSIPQLLLSICKSERIIYFHFLSLCN